jgi:hypothetical protein
MEEVDALNEAFTLPRAADPGGRPLRLYGKHLETGAGVQDRG